MSESSGIPHHQLLPKSESGRSVFVRRESNLGWPCASKPCTPGSKEQEDAQREGSSEVNQDEQKNEPLLKEDQREGEARHSDVPTLGRFHKSAGERFSRGEVPRGSCEPSAERTTDPSDRREGGDQPLRLRTEENHAGPIRAPSNQKEEDHEAENRRGLWHHGERQDPRELWLGGDRNASPPTVDDRHAQPGEEPGNSVRQRSGIRSGIWNRTPKV